MRVLNLHRLLYKIASLLYAVKNAASRCRPNEAEFSYSTTNVENSISRLCY